MTSGCGATLKAEFMLEKSICDPQKIIINAISAITMSKIRQVFVSFQKRMDACVDIDRGNL